MVRAAAVTSEGARGCLGSQRPRPLTPIPPQQSKMEDHLDEAIHVLRSHAVGTAGDVHGLLPGHGALAPGFTGPVMPLGGRHAGLVRAGRAARQPAGGWARGPGKPDRLPIHRSEAAPQRTARRAAVASCTATWPSPASRAPSPTSPGRLTPTAVSPSLAWPGWPAQGYPAPQLCGWDPLVVGSSQPSYVPPWKKGTQRAYHRGSEDHQVAPSICSLPGTGLGLGPHAACQPLTVAHGLRIVPPPFPVEETEAEEKARSSTRTRCPGSQPGVGERCLPWWEPAGAVPIRGTCREAREAGRVTGGSASFEREVGPSTLGAASEQARLWFVVAPALSSPDTRVFSISRI